MMHALQSVDQRQASIAAGTPAERKSELGQFMTPSGIARFMASMFSAFGGSDVRLLDAGAGIGSLTAAFVTRAATERPASISCEVWEIDPNMAAPLSETMGACGEAMHSASVTFHQQTEDADFVEKTSVAIATGRAQRFTHAILNPPYKKIRSDSIHRAALRLVGVETTNLYSAFVALALLSLEDGGELVAITPRSFCNGTYFKPFRRLILERSSILRMHVFGSRTDAFKGDKVLQENVIFHLAKGRQQGDVMVSSSTDSSLGEQTQRIVPFREVVCQSAFKFDHPSASNFDQGFKLISCAV